MNSASGSFVEEVRKSLTPSTSNMSAMVGGGNMGGGSGEDWSTTLTKYGLPFATLAICAAGSVYFSKRMSDLEQNVGAIRRNEVRHLSETDVRLIVQQMAKDGLIHVPQWSRDSPATTTTTTTAALANQHQQQQQQQPKQFYSATVHQQQQQHTRQVSPQQTTQASLPRVGQAEIAKFEQMASDWKRGRGASAPSEPLSNQDETVSNNSSESAQ
jgi:hypothetical protein